MSGWWTAILCTALSLAMTIASRGVAQATDPAQIIIGFLYNFTKYVDWPAGAIEGASSFRYCLMTESSWNPLLDDLRTRQVHKKNVEIIVNVERMDVRDCHLLFISKQSERHVTAAMLAQLEKSSILVVSENRDIGMIQLVNIDGQIRFEVNLVRARAAQLNFNSRLLQLAQRVEQ